MTTATVTSKGQVTIPLEVRRRMGICVGAKLEFIPDDANTYRIVCRKRSVMDLAGFLKYDGPAIFVEEMDEAIAQILKEDDERICKELQ